jgi:CRP-like cAMP-binding protein
MDRSIPEGCPLFRGIAAGDISKMLDCLCALPRSYQKGEYILHAGDRSTQMGLVLEGSVHVIEEDFYGNRQILSTLSEGDLFGESYACAPDAALLVSVIASVSCTILFLDVHRVLTVCGSACAFHSALIRNLLAILAEKNLTLTRKIEHMGQKTIRDKVLSYLSAQSALAQKRTFEIPLNRQQLADYLAVDRSALSAELSRMQRDHLISFERNRFTI